MRRPRRGRGDAGQVGGIEAIPFGLLIFVLGTLLIANAWAVVDAKFATDAAAREAARTFVEAEDPQVAEQSAVDAALHSIEGHGRDPSRAAVTTLGDLALERCQRATFRVEYTVPAINIPLIGGYGSSPFRVTSTHSEVVDPFRSGLTGTVEGCS